MTDTTTQLLNPGPIRLAYIGNFGPEHSTENHLARAWRNNGHEVIEYQEEDRLLWDALIADIEDDNNGWFDLVMWTSTAGLAARIPDEVQRRLLTSALHAGIPTVGYHLDRWWGLERQHLVTERPFFRCELLVTADGGHDRQWADAGINHLWMPPGVSRDEALREPSERAGRYGRYQVAFVGSWRSYHPEWLPYRRELVKNLEDWYGERLLLVEGGLRGQGLVDLYRTVPVIVGDSCLAPNADGGPATKYASDRCPETVGRGGFLIHPSVEGITDGMYQDGEHLATYELSEWDGLQILIETALQAPEDRREIAALGREHVLNAHTYDTRVRQLVEELTARKMLPSVTA